MMVALTGLQTLTLNGVCLTGTQAWIDHPICRWRLIRTPLELGPVSRRRAFTWGRHAFRERLHSIFARVETVLQYVLLHLGLGVWSFRLRLVVIYHVSNVYIFIWAGWGATTISAAHSDIVSFLLRPSTLCHPGQHLRSKWRSANFFTFILSPIGNKYNRYHEKTENLFWIKFTRYTM